MSTKRAFVDSTIKQNKVVIFSKTYCRFCTETKELFKRLEVEGVEVIELDKRKDGKEIQQELEDKTRQRTVPNVFVQEQHVGGNDKVQAAYESGHLQTLLSSIVQHSSEFDKHGSGDGRGGSGVVKKT